jgi:hypothetical protein
VASRPSNQLCWRSHATVSWPSVISCCIGSKSPPEPNVPRTLCSSTWYPRSAKICADCSANRPVRPYGQRTSTVGADATLTGM